MFKERVKELRESKGLTQSQLSKKLQIGRASVSNYELGARTPDIDVLVKISEYFNVTTDYLTGRSEFKTFEEELQHKNTVEKLGIEKDIESLTEQQKTTLLKTVDFLYDSLVEFFVSGAAENNILESDLNGGKIIIKAINDFAKFINTTSQLYKLSAHTQDSEKLKEIFINFQKEMAKAEAQNPAGEFVYSDPHNIINGTLDIIRYANIIFGLKNSITDYLLAIEKSYTPKMSNYPT